MKETRKNKESNQRRRGKLNKKGIKDERQNRNEKK